MIACLTYHIIFSCIVTGKPDENQGTTSERVR